MTFKPTFNSHPFLMLFDKANDHKRQNKRFCTNVSLKGQKIHFFNVRSFSRRHRERAWALRAHEQPCLFVLRARKWRRAETKRRACVCERECAVIERQRTPSKRSSELITTDSRRRDTSRTRPKGVLGTRFGFLTLLSQPS